MIAMPVMIAVIAPGTSCSVTPQHNTGTCSPGHYGPGPGVDRKYPDLTLSVILKYRVLSFIKTQR